MGGANVPALNRLLLRHYVALSDRVIEARIEVMLDDHRTVHICSGSTVTKVPRNSRVWIAASVDDQAEHVLLDEQRIKHNR
jgi:hypothetical protein